MTTELFLPFSSQEKFQFVPELDLDLEVASQVHNPNDGVILERSYELYSLDNDVLPNLEIYPGPPPGYPEDNILYHYVIRRNLTQSAWSSKRFTSQDINLNDFNAWYRKKIDLYHIAYYIHEVIGEISFIPNFEQDVNTMIVTPLSGYILTINGSSQVTTSNEFTFDLGKAWGLTTSSLPASWTIDNLDESLVPDEDFQLDLDVKLLRQNKLKVTKPADSNIATLGRPSFTLTFYGSYWLSELNQYRTHKRELFLHSPSATVEDKLRPPLHLDLPNYFDDGNIIPENRVGLDRFLSGLF